MFASLHASFSCLQFQMAGKSAYLYYATTTVDEDPDNIPMADDDSLPPSSLTEIIQQSRRRVKPALRRRSPPIASEDELTDSVGLQKFWFNYVSRCFKMR